MAGKAQDALSPEQKADLANQAAKQNEIAKRLSKLEAKLDEMAKKLEKDRPPRRLRPSATPPSRAASRPPPPRWARPPSSSTRTRWARPRPARRRPAATSRRWSTRSRTAASSELSRLVAELKATEANLKKLRRQAGRQPQEDPAGPPGARRPEAHRQAPATSPRSRSSFQDDLKKQLQKLAKLNNEAGRSPGRRRPSRWPRPRANMEQDQGEQAEGDEGEALQDLKQAQQEVADARKEAEEQLAMEQIAKMADALKSIAERQNKVVDESDQVREDQGRERRQAHPRPSAPASRSWAGSRPA